MRIGYAKEKRAEIIEKLREQLNVERIFIDKPGENCALREIVQFSRAGDVIVVRSMWEISLTAGGLVEFIVQVKQLGVDVQCEAERLDTGTFVWSHFLEVLSVYRRNYGQGEADKPQFYSQLEQYFALVEASEITVAEVCDKMQIGKSTYYRYWRKIKQPVRPVRHTELFDVYLEQITRGEITVAEACRQMGIGTTTFYRMKKRLEETGAWECQ